MRQRKGNLEVPIWRRSFKSEVAQAAEDTAVVVVARAAAVMEVVAADLVATKPSSTSINRTAPEGSDMPSGAVLFHIADQ